MKTVTLLPLFFMLLIFSCNKEEEQTDPTRLISFSIDPSYTTSQTDNWIIVHDQNGATLEYKTFEGGEDIIIDTRKPVTGKIGFTLLQYLSEDANQFYNLNSYLDIEKGQTFSIQSPALPASGTIIGSYDVTVSDYGTIDQFSLTNRFSNSCGGSGSNELTLNCSISSESPKSILQISNKADELKYKTFENMNPGDSYIVSFNEMSEFDNTVEFNFPQSDNVLLLVTGREPDQSYDDAGYLLNYHFDSDVHTKIKAGYLQSLGKYITILSVNYPTYGYTYKNIGNIPDPSIPWPSKSDFSISSKVINNFSASTGAPFERRLSYWRYQNPLNAPLRRVSWRVSSTSETHSFSELPLEIINQHPLLAFENLQPGSTTFYTQSRPYSDFIKDDLQGKESLTGTDIGIIIK